MEEVKWAVFLGNQPNWHVRSSLLSQATYGHIDTLKPGGLAARQNTKEGAEQAGHTPLTN